MDHSCEEIVKIVRLFRLVQAGKRRFPPETDLEGW